MSLRADDFFAQNGGDALLRAYGKDGSGLAAFLGSTLPSWPKSDGSISKGGSRPAPMSGLAVVIVTEGRLRIASAVAPPANLPKGVTMERLATDRTMPLMASECIDLPRPLLFLTVGPAYRDAIARAKLSFDPMRIEICGIKTASLDKDRLTAIDEVRDATGLAVKDLYGMASKRELASLQVGRTLTSDDTIKKINKALKTPKGQRAEPAQIREFWQTIDRLPPTIDPSWRLAFARADAA